jgi:hypothetical protein
MKNFIHQINALFLIITIVIFSCSCGGGGGAGVSSESASAQGELNSENGVTLKTTIDSSVLSKPGRSKANNVIVSNAAGEISVLTSVDGSNYEALLSETFIEGPLLIQVDGQARNLRKVVLETGLDENRTIDAGRTDRRSTSFSYLVQSSLNENNWLEQLNSDASLVERFKTQFKTLVSDNVTVNDLKVNMKGAGKVTILSHLGNIMFDNNKTFDVSHNSNIEETSTYSLVKSGPADIIITPTDDSEFYSLRVLKGDIPYESGASYNTKYKYYEASTFIDHLELGFYARDIKIDIEFRWKNNQAPVISSTAITTGVLDKQYTYNVAATDGNGDTLSYELSEKPNGMTIDSGGNITWMTNVWGDSDVSVVVSDGILETTQSYTLTGTNNPPDITSLANRTATVNTAYTYTVQATDQDGDTLIYELITKPDGMTIVADTGVINWTPTTTGTVPVEVRVRDNRSAPFFNYTFQIFGIVVSP